MTNLYPQNWSQYLDIILVFLRLLGLFVWLPVFSHASIPGTVRLLLAMAMSLAMYPIVHPYLGGAPVTLGAMAGGALRESLVGLLMGFVAYITFEAIELAAQFVGSQMGLGAAGLMDPMNHSQVSVIVPLHTWLTLMVFLFANLHHEFIRLFAVSFEMTHVSQFTSWSGPGMLSAFFAVTAKLFLVAVQMAAPFTLLLFGLNIAIGVFARLLPQMNMLVFSFTLTLMFGLGGLYIVAPDMLNYMEGLLGEMSHDVLTVLRVL